MAARVVVYQSDRDDGRPLHSLHCLKYVDDDMSVPSGADYHYSLNHFWGEPINSCIVGWPDSLMPCRRSVFQMVVVRILRSSGSE